MNRLEVRTTIEQLLIRVEVGDTGSNPVSRGTIYISDWRSLASASALGAEGRGFESLIRDQLSLTGVTAASRSPKPLVGVQIPGETPIHGRVAQSVRALL